MDNEHEKIENKKVGGKSAKEIFVSMNFSRQDVTIKDTGSYIGHRLRILSYII